MSDLPKAPPLVCLIEFVHLGHDDQVLHPLVLKPILQLEIFFHPAPASVQNKERHFQLSSFAEIAFDELFPVIRHTFRNPGVTVTRKINEIEPAVNAVEIDGLGATRSATCESQTFLPN